MRENIPCDPINFEDFGFQRGSIVLPGMNTPCKLPSNVYFRYRGDVPNLAEEILKTKLALQGRIDASRSRIATLLDWPLDSIMSFIYAIRLRDQFDRAIASCYDYNSAYEEGGIRPLEIIKREGLNPTLSAFADGYGSGDLLHKINRPDVLQTVVDSMDVLLDVQDFKGENFADIGGMVALHHKRAQDDSVDGVPTFRTRPPVSDVIQKAFGF